MVLVVLLDVGFSVVVVDLCSGFVCVVFLGILYWVVRYVCVLFGCCVG